MLTSLQKAILYFLLFLTFTATVIFITLSLSTIDFVKNYQFAYLSFIAALLFLALTTIYIVTHYCEPPHLDWSSSSLGSDSL